MSSFTASIQGFADKTKTNLRYIMRSSINDVLVAAQTTQHKAAVRGGPPERGKIPVDSAVLLNSLTVDGATGPASYDVVIGGMEPGDVKDFAWTAPYAMRIEHGFTGEDSLGRYYNQPGAHFVGDNAARFQEFVDKRVAEVKK